MGLVAGLQAVNGRTMGHAGAFQGKEYSGSAHAKILSLENAGVVMTDHPAKFGLAMRSLLAAELKPRGVKGAEKPQASTLFASSPATPKRFDVSQNRSIYANTRLVRPRRMQARLAIAKRGLHVKGPHALDLLESLGIPILFFPPRQKAMRITNFFRIIFNLSRQSFTPSISLEQEPGYIPGVRNYQYVVFGMDEPAEEVDRRIQLICQPNGASFGPNSSLPKIISELRRFFMDKEGRVFTLLITEVSPNNLRVYDANLKFTNEPYRSAGRHQDIHALRDEKIDAPEELESGKDGIVYIK